MYNGKMINFIQIHISIIIKKMYVPLESHPNSVYTHFQQRGPSMNAGNVEHAKEWSPYENNSGTVLAIGLPKMLIIAGDTRLSHRKYSILSREQSKIAKLASKTFLATSGMFADFTALKKLLQAKLQIYQYQNDREVKMKLLNKLNQASTETIAQLLSKSLYQKRFFPFYTFNCLAGLDEEGNGVVYGYDAIGSYDKLKYVVQGSGQELIVPVYSEHFIDYFPAYNKRAKQIPSTRNEVVDLVLDCFNAASERDIYTGDSVEIYIITPDGEERQVFDLRKD